MNVRLAIPERTLAELNPMAAHGRRQPLLSNPLECPSWVNNGLSQPTAATSAFRGKADEISTITDIGQRMSAVGGRADVFCQGLSGPFIAKRRHCDVVEWEPSIASEADLGMKLGSRGFPISASLGCAPSSRVRIIQTANYSKRVPRKSSRKQKSTFEILYFTSHF